MPSSEFNRDGKEHVHLGFTFDEAAQCAEHWRNDLGIDRAFVVLAGWIHRGYDVGHPDVLPAAPECGGSEGLFQAARRIKACGYLFGLHDNYQDMYEDAPSWGQQWLNKNSKGVARKGGNWNGGQAWQVCAIKQVELAARPETNLPKIAPCGNARRAARINGKAGRRQRRFCPRAIRRRSSSGVCLRQPHA